MLRLAAAFVLLATPAVAEVTRQDCLFLLRNGSTLVMTMIESAPVRIGGLDRDPQAAAASAAAEDARQALNRYLEELAAYCSARFPS